MENKTMRFIAAAPQMPISGQLALLCAAPATDLRTFDVRSDVRFGKAPVADPSIWGGRVRGTATTTGMGHVDAGHIVLAAGYVPGSRTWSPPI